MTQTNKKQKTICIDMKTTMHMPQKGREDKHKLKTNLGTTIHSLCIREDKLQFLQKIVPIKNTADDQDKLTFPIQTK